MVIDYKGSLSADYEPFATEGRPPAKVQTLVYAQVVKRLLGLDVVGALPEPEADDTATCACRRALDGLPLPFELP